MQRTTVATIDGTSWPVAGWTDNSINGGTVSSDGSEITLSQTSALNSSARFNSDVDYGPDVGFLGKFRDDASGTDESYLGVGVRGYGGYQSQYGDKSHIFEGSPGASVARLVKQSNTLSNSWDGGCWTYFEEYSAPGHPFGPVATWVRYEMIGPVVRVRSWLDGNQEPATWDEEYVDPHIRDAGKVGVAFSHNTNVSPTSTLILERLEVY